MHLKCSYANQQIICSSHPVVRSSVIFLMYIFQLKLLFCNGNMLRFSNYFLFLYHQKDELTEKCMWYCAIWRFGIFLLISMTGSIMNCHEQPPIQFHLCVREFMNVFFFYLRLILSSHFHGIGMDLLQKWLHSIL